MSAWEDEYLDDEVEAYIDFDERGGGAFQFGYIRGVVDYRAARRDGKPTVEFSWEGGDGADGTPLTGRAWAVLDGDELTHVDGLHIIWGGSWRRASLESVKQNEHDVAAEL